MSIELAKQVASEVFNHDDDLLTIQDLAEAIRNEVHKWPYKIQCTFAESVLWRTGAAVSSWSHHYCIAGVTATPEQLCHAALDAIRGEIDLERVSTDVKAESSNNE